MNWKKLSVYKDLILCTIIAVIGMIFFLLAFYIALMNNFEFEFGANIIASIGIFYMLISVITIKKKPEVKE